MEIILHVIPFSYIPESDFTVIKLLVFIVSCYKIHYGLNLCNLNIFGLTCMWFLMFLQPASSGHLLKCIFLHFSIAFIFFDCYFFHLSSLTCAVYLDFLSLVFFVEWFIFWMAAVKNFYTRTGVKNFRIKIFFLNFLHHVVAIIYHFKMTWWVSKKPHWKYFDSTPKKSESECYSS